MAANGGGPAAAGAMPPPPPRAKPEAADANAANADAFSFPTLKVAEPITAEPPRPSKSKEPLTARSTVRRAEAPGVPGAPPVLTAAARLAKAEGARGGGGGAAGRQKVPLEKGYSQVDWLRLTRTGGADVLTGGRAYSPDGISLAELRAHGPQQLRPTRMGAAGGAEGAGGAAAAGATDAKAATAARSDAEGAGGAAAAEAEPPSPRLWMALNGRVYDITAYLPFHPGGAQILEKASGTDATALFRRYHPWVNAGALLEACCLGRLGGGGGGGGAGGAGAAPAAPGGGGAARSSSSSPPAAAAKASSSSSSFSAGVRSLFGRGGGQQ